jgi:hypothetical protein
MSLARQPEWALGLVVVVGLATAQIVGVAGGGQKQQQKKFVGSELFRTYCATCHGTRCALTQAWSHPELQRLAVGDVIPATPIGPTRCRFVSRYRVACSNDLTTRLSCGPTFVEAIGFAMDRRMLLGVKQRAEATPRRVLAA